MEKNFGVWMLEELKLNVPTEWASFRNKAGQGKSLSSYWDLKTEKTILSATRMLKGSNICFNAVYSDIIKKRRRDFMPQLSAAQQRGETASLRYDKFVIMPRSEPVNSWVANWRSFSWFDFFFCDLINNISDDNTELLMLGDLNIDYFSTNCHLRKKLPSVANFCNRTQVVNLPTRVFTNKADAKSSTCMDPILPMSLSTAQKLCL